MKTYITKPKTVKKQLLVGQRNSLCPKDHRNLFESEIYKPLSELINKEFQGQEIGSDAYMLKSEYRFLKTVNVTQSFLIDEATIEYCKPLNSKNPQKGDILIVKDGGGEGLGEVCYYGLDNEQNKDGVSAGVLVINVKETLRFYVLGILKSQHFKDFINLNTPEASTIRHAKKAALSYNVPFPSLNNHAQPDLVIRYISLLVQNLIDLLLVDYQYFNYFCKKTYGILLSYPL
jgi:hypothetical protein